MDPQGLCRLLDASLRQWDIEGHCAASGETALGAVVTLPSGEVAEVARLHPEGARLPVWRFSIGDRPPIEAVSIRQALKVLRMELDPQFRPGRAIIGIRPRATPNSPPGGATE